MPRTGFAEPKVQKQLEDEGWDVYYTNSGFPDFFCVKNGQVKLVEAKHSGGVNIRQHGAFERLEKAGFKVEVRFA